MGNAKPVYVIGHRNPDTDSICSAIAYANLKKTQGDNNVIAARAGQINPETKYALDYFNVELPLLVSDLYPRVKDIMLECNTVVTEKDTLRHLGKVMQDNSLRSVPVTDDNGQLTGIVTVSDLAQRYFEELNIQNLDDAKVPLSSVVKIIGGKTVVPSDEDAIVLGKVLIAAGSKSTISRLLAPGDVVLVGEGRFDSMMESLQHDISCLIVTNDGTVPDDIITEAKRTNTLVVTTQIDTYTAARLINQCVPVGHIMKRHMTSFSSQELLSNIKGTIDSTNYRNYPVEENGRLVGLVSRDNLMVPEPERVILIDHNERGQAVEGIENAKILEIIDHHRLGGMQTGDPIFIREEPVGCTATIIANMYWQRGVDISRSIAGILLSAILSDTVLFKSPTCTDMDRDAAKKLAEIAGVTIEKYGMDMLKAGSTVGSMSSSEIAKNDCKEFQIGDYRILVSQVSVMDTAEVLNKKAEILKCMENNCEQEGFDMSLLMVTDILQESTELLYVGSPKTIIGTAFRKDASGDSIYLPGVMSRKKQIIPQLTEAVSLIKK